MVKLKSMIKFLDLFPETFEFNMNGKGPKQTVAGGFISIIAVISLLLTSIWTFINFLTIRKASVIYETLYDNLFEPSTIDNSHGQFLLSMFNYNNFKQKELQLNSSNIFQFDVDFTKSKNLRIKPIGNFVNCDQQNTNQDLANQIIHKYPNFNLSGLICTNFSEPFFELGGDVFGGLKTYHLQYNLTIDMCNFVNCTTTDWKNFNTHGFSMFFTDYFFNVSDPKGYSKFTNNFQFYFIPGQKGQLKMKMIKNKITTYDYLILGDGRNETFYNTADEITFSQITLANQPGPNLFNMEIIVKMPFYIKTISRIYPRLHTYLASINAFCSIFLIIAKFAVQISNYGNVDFHLMRNLYYIYQPDVIDSESLKKEFSLKNKKLKKRHQSSDSMDSIADLQINTTKEIEINSAQQRIKLIETFLKGTEFKKEWISWISYTLCCRKQNDMRNSIKHYLYGQSMLKYDLNIVVMLKKLIDFESLFEILFDFNQLEAINGIHRRKILNDMKIEEVIQGLRHNYKNKVSEQRIENFVSGFHHCSKYVGRNSKNKKILNNIKIT